MISTNFDPLRYDERFSSIWPLFHELCLIWCILDSLPELLAVNDHPVLMTFGCEPDSRSRLAFLIPQPPESDLETRVLNHRVSVGKFYSSASPPHDARQLTWSLSCRMDESYNKEFTSESETSVVRQSSCEMESPPPAVERNNCDLCPKEYSGPNSLNSLRRHKREEHSVNLPQHCCRFCTHQSTRKHNIRAHEKRRHGHSEGAT